MPERGLRPALPAAAQIVPTIETGGPRLALCALLAANAHATPHRIAFIDPAGKASWTGRTAISWTYGAAAEIVARLANGLKGWRLPAGSRIGLLAAGGSETMLSYLAVEAAGHIPCLLPAGWDEDRLVAGVQAAGIAAILTQSHFAGTAPADRLRRVALRYFGLRYLAAFGPDVPDGVINLDGMVLDERGGPFAPETGGLVTFAAGDPARPFHRPADAVAAAISAHLAAGRIAPGERILSLLPPSDLRGLVTGLGAALASGAGLETLAPFDAAGFATALANPVATHLVAPGGLERNLAASRLPDSLRSVTLAHKAPGRLPARLLRSDEDRTVIDAIAFDETAILTASRADRDLAHILARADYGGLSRSLIEFTRDRDDRLGFRGHACKASPLQRDIPPAKPAEDWSWSPFQVFFLAGRAIGILRV